MMNSFEDQIKEQFADATGKKFVELVEDEVDQQVNLIKKGMIEYIEHMEHKIRGCSDGDFMGVPCLVMDDKIGFIDHDRRPGHAVWLRKKDAERVIKIIRTNAKQSKEEIS